MKILLALFSLVFIGCGLTPEEMRNQIDECEKYNLKPYPIYDLLTLEIVKIKCHPKQLKDPK